MSIPLLAFRRIRKELIRKGFNLLFQNQQEKQRYINLLGNRNDRLPVNTKNLKVNVNGVIKPFNDAVRNNIDENMTGLQTRNLSKKRTKSKTHKRHQPKTFHKNKVSQQGKRKLTIINENITIVEKNNKSRESKQREVKVNEVKQNNLRTYKLDYSIYEVRYYGSQIEYELVDGAPQLITVNKSDIETEKKKVIEEIEEALSSSYDRILVPAGENPNVDDHKNLRANIIDITPSDVGIDKIEMKGVKSHYHLIGQFPQKKMNSCVYNYLEFKYNIKKRDLQRGDLRKTSINDLYNWCIKRDISHIPINVDNEVIEKYVYTSKNRHQPALIYKFNDAHLYPIECPKLRDRIVKNRTLFLDININTLRKDIDSHYISEKYPEIHTHEVFDYIDSFEAKQAVVFMLKSIHTLDKNYDSNKQFHLDELVKYMILTKKLYPDHIEIQNKHITAVNYKNHFITINPQFEDIKAVYSIIHKSKLFNEVEKKQFDPNNTASINSNSFTSIMKNIMQFKFNELPKSSYSIETQQFFEYGSKGPFFGQIKEEKKNWACGAIDRSKSYRNIMYHKKKPFMIFDMFCKLEDFENSDAATQYEEKKTLIPGVYSIIGEYEILGVPFNCGKWSAEALEYLLNHNIINVNQIDKFIRPRYLIDNTYFKKMIDFILSVGFENKHEKDLINKYIGVLGKTSYKKESVIYTQDFNTANALFSEYYNDSIKNELTPKQSIDFLEGDDLYKIVREQTVKLNTNHRPIFEEILELSIVELHKMQSFLDTINTRRHIVAYRNDAIYFQCETKKEIEDINKKVKKHKSYRIESYHPPTSYNMDFDYKFPFEIEGNMKWKTKKITSSEFKMKKGCFLLSGQGGLGKSHIIKNNIIPYYIKKKKKILITALSDKACSNIGKIEGVDVKNCAQILIKHPLENDYRYQQRVSQYDVYIVDEISMISIKLMETLYNLKQQGKTIICCGDFQQIPPPKKIIIDYYNTAAFKDMCDFNEFELQYHEEVKSRFNADTYNYLSHFRNTGKLLSYKVVDKADDIYKFKRHICYFNSTKDKINEKLVKKYGFISLNNVIIADKKTSKYTRCSYFRITKIENKEVELQNINTNKCITLNKKVIEKHFIPSYAITADMSQCSNINEPYLIHNVKQMKKKRLYVALSRATNYEFIHFSSQPLDQYIEESYTTDPILYTLNTKTGYLYALTDEKNNVFYVGSTFNDKKRKAEHKKTYPDCKFHIIKQGEFLDTCELEEFEYKMIQQYATDHNLINVRGLKEFNSKLESNKIALDLLSNPHCFTILKK